MPQLRKEELLQIAVGGLKSISDLTIKLDEQHKQLFQQRQAVESAANLYWAMEGLCETENNFPEAALEAAKRLYESYYTMCYGRISLPPLESFASVNTRSEKEKEGNEPPQNRTVKWYKANGYGPFLRNCAVVTFLSGKYRGKKCLIRVFNGNNCKCYFFEDNSYHYVTNTFPLTWTWKEEN